MRQRQGVMARCPVAGAAADVGRLSARLAALDRQPKELPAAFGGFWPAVHGAAAGVVQESAGPCRSRTAYQKFPTKLPFFLILPLRITHPALLGLRQSEGRPDTGLLPPARDPTLPGFGGARWLTPCARPPAQHRAWRGRIHQRPVVRRVLPEPEPGARWLPGQDAVSGQVTR